MDIQAGVNEVQRLLNEEYGIDIDDCSTEDEITTDIANGEDPQAIVDDLAARYDLDRIDNPRISFAGYRDHTLN